MEAGVCWIVPREPSRPSTRELQCAIHEIHFENQWMDGLAGCAAEGRKRLPDVNILVTGSSGLIGSEAVEYFDHQGHEVTGVDNNFRRLFFGPGGDTLWNLDRLKKNTKRFKHAALDIRDRGAIDELFRTGRFSLIVHCAAQP